jgi:hypothetical protein
MSSSGFQPNRGLIFGLFVTPSQALGTARRLRFDTMRDPETIDSELRLIAACAVRSATKVARCRLPH